MSQGQYTDLKEYLSSTELLISMSLAILHLILELAFLKVEAKAMKTNIWNYSVICFNARFMFVPFTDKFYSLCSHITSNWKEPLDYDNIKTTICEGKGCIAKCNETSFTYMFSDATI